jgi:predicted metal-dependent hydrolase
MRAQKTKRKKTKLSPPKRELLKIEGRTVEIILRANPRARRFIVKVDPSTGEVSVVAPSSRSLDRALDFARKEKEWIADRLADIPAPVPLTLGAPILFRGAEHVIRLAERNDGEFRRGPVWIDRDAVRPTIRVSGRPEHAARRVLDWLKREARSRIDEKAAEYADAIGVKAKRITIRDTTSRWGSCSSARSLSFSWRLVLAPPMVLDYVVGHEVCHLKEMNHGPRFWRLVQTIIPNMERPQAWLGENGALLHRYAPRQRPLE